MEGITFTCQQCGIIKTTYNNPNQSFKYCSRKCYQLSRGAVVGGKTEIK